MTDVIRDAIETVIGYVRDGRLELQAAAEAAERDVRINWGGERVYIGKTGAEDLREKSRRDAAINRDWQRGDHIPVLARRYGLSDRRIKQIVQVERMETVCLTDFQSAGHDALHDPVRNQSAGQVRRGRHAR